MLGNPRVCAIYDFLCFSNNINYYKVYKRFFSFSVTSRAKQLSLSRHTKSSWCDKENIGSKSEGGKNK